MVLYTQTKSNVKRAYDLKMSQINDPDMIITTKNDESLLNNDL